MFANSEDIIPCPQAKLAKPLQEGSACQSYLFMASPFLLLSLLSFSRKFYFLITWLYLQFYFMKISVLFPSEHILTHEETQIIYISQKKRLGKYLGIQHLPHCLCFQKSLSYMQKMLATPKLKSSTIWQRLGGSVS